MQKIINALNEHEDYDTKTWGIVQPPLARLLSRPAVEYEKAMVLHHPKVEERIREIINLIIANDRLAK